MCSAVPDGRVASDKPDLMVSSLTGGAPRPGRFFGSRSKKQLQALGPLAALAGLVALFGLAAPNFVSSANGQAILEAAVVPAVVALGLTFVLLQGSIDLSVEGVASLSNIILSILIANSVTAHSLGLWAVPVAIGVGAGVGLINGLICAFVKMPSLIVTLGAWLTTQGIASLLFPARQPQILDTRITGLAIDKHFGLSGLVYLTIALALLALAVERTTRFGRLSRAIGENEAVLRMSGIRVTRHRLAAFTIAGAAFALAGIFLGAQIGVGNPLAGSGLLFPAIAACVVGGTLLSGGHGGVLQSLVGVLILVTLRNGLIQIGVNPLLQSTLEGAVIIIAVAASTWHLRRKTRVIK